MVCLCCTKDEEKQVCFLYQRDTAFQHQHSFYWTHLWLASLSYPYRNLLASFSTINAELALSSAVTMIMMECAGVASAASVKSTLAFSLVSWLTPCASAFLAAASRRRPSSHSAAATLEKRRLISVRRTRLNWKLRGDQKLISLWRESFL